MRRRTDDTGSAAAELVIIAPLFLAFLGAFVTGAELLLAHQQVVDAVRGAVEAASSAPGAGEAAAAARSVGESDLGGSLPSCARAEVSTATSHFSPGGSVSVAISCAVSLPGLAFASVPSVVEVSASAEAPLEPYRVIGP